MIVSSVTMKDFEDTFGVLLNMKKDMYQTNETLKESIRISKEKQIPLLEKPLIEVQTNLIDLRNLVNLHHLNCIAYKDLIAGDLELDDLFIQQLKFLLEMTKEISIMYEFLKQLSNEIPNYSDCGQVDVPPKPKQHLPLV